MWINQSENHKSLFRNPILLGTMGYLFLFIFRPFEYWEWIGTYHLERIYVVGLIFAMVFSSRTRYKHHPLVSAFLFFFWSLVLFYFDCLPAG